MSTLVVDGGAVADVEGNIHTWHGARGQRPMSRKLRGADPVLAPHQKGRPVPTAWPEMFWSRVEVEACLATLGDQSNCRGYPVAERVVLDWLEAQEGRTGSSDGWRRGRMLILRSGSQGCPGPAHGAAVSMSNGYGRRWPG